ncbi:hypothetical protein GF339_02115, partial [candidate division KSB3 bacterium]|nr:hypothetical protein [candidate division KSB3 bacterium]MBD3323347.1 hypothetical protein [candidate division KSB3 bacterium]
MSDSQNTRRTAILEKLYALMTELLQDVPSEQDLHVPFLEMGANSLTLMELVRAVEKTFGVKLTIRQFFGELTTIDALAAYIDQTLPPDTAEPIPQEISTGTAATGSSNPPQSSFSSMMPDVSHLSGSLSGELSPEVEQILTHQLQVASQTMAQVVSQQLEFLRQRGVSLKPDRQDEPTNEAPQTIKPPQSPPKTPATAQSSEKTTALPFPKLRLDEMRARGLTPEQHHHLEALIARINALTPESKRRTQQYRPVLADNRASAGFRFTTKDMLYPIIGTRSRGSRIWDVDGNEYIDLAMGFGV